MRELCVSSMLQRSGLHKTCITQYKFQIQSSKVTLIMGFLDKFCSLLIIGCQRFVCKKSGIPLDFLLFFPLEIQTEKTFSFLVPVHNFSEIQTKTKILVEKPWKSTAQIYQKSLEIQPPIWGKSTIYLE